MLFCNDTALDLYVKEMFFTIEKYYSSIFIHHFNYLMIDLMLECWELVYWGESNQRNVMFFSIKITVFVIKSGTTQTFLLNIVCKVTDLFPWFIFYYELKKFIPIISLCFFLRAILKKFFFKYFLDVTSVERMVFVFEGFQKLEKQSIGFIVLISESLKNKSVCFLPLLINQLLNF